MAATNFALSSSVRGYKSPFCRWPLIFQSSSGFLSSASWRSESGFPHGFLDNLLVFRTQGIPEGSIGENYVIQAPVVGNRHVFLNVLVVLGIDIIKGIFLPVYGFVIEGGENFRKGQGLGTCSQGPELGRLEGRRSGSGTLSRENLPGFSGAAWN